MTEDALRCMWLRGVEVPHFCAYGQNLEVILTGKLTRCYLRINGNLPPY